MKKILLIVSILISSTFLFAKDAPVSEVPEWVKEAFIGNTKPLYQTLGIDPEEETIFVINNRSAEDIDLKKKSYVDLLQQLEYLTIPEYKYDFGMLPILCEETQYLSGHKKYAITDSSKNRLYYDYYAGEENQGYFYCIFTDDSSKFFYENLDPIINLYETRTSYAKKVKLCKEYYTFLKTDTKPAKQSGASKGIGVKGPRFVIVDHGTSPVSDKEYEIRQYVAVYTLPRSEYNKLGNLRVNK